MYAYAHTPLDEEPYNLLVSPQVINFLHSLEVFMDLKDYRTSLQNNCLPSLKPS